jgi:hypothetical protein
LFPYCSRPLRKRVENGFHCGMSKPDKICNSLKIGNLLPQGRLSP